ncbi:MAG TPA: NrsF family protein [Aliidongia sp.]|nr:NrsF family protein [Aliidongia sp.]
MSSVKETDRLIRDLAHELATRRGRTAPPLLRRLLFVAAQSLAIAIALVFLLYGVSPELMVTVRSAPFHHKSACTLALACGGFFLVREAARPEGKMERLLVALLPGLALLALGGATDASGLRTLGLSGVAFPNCIGSIVLVSLPALAMIVGTLRTGAPTRPIMAGAAAGLLAGALGAAAYGFACKQDGGLYVAIWYSAGMLIVAGLGALWGRRALAW